MHLVIQPILRLLTGILFTLLFWLYIQAVRSNLDDTQPIRGPRPPVPWRSCTVMGIATGAIMIVAVGLMVLLARQLTAPPPAGASAATPPEATGLPAGQVGETPLPPEAAATPMPAPTPTPSGPQGKIAFTCQLFKDSKRNQVCWMLADGSAQVRITQDDNADHLFPSFAPDGQTILYSANLDGGYYQIYESDLAGNARQVTTLTGQALAPAVSPDGLRIVFAYKLPERQTIWIANRDGSDPHPVEPAYAGEGWDPVWSPDGRQILFASDRAGEVQLFVINLDGSELRQVTNLTGLRGRSDWSPDGLWMSTYAGGAWTREIYLFDTNGQNARAVTQGGNNLAPSFSPDGGWITFTSYRDRFEDPNGCEIYVMRVDGSEVIRLTDNDVCDWQPRWGK